MDSVKFWRRLRRPITSLVVAESLFVAGFAWSQAEQGAAAASDESAVALLDAFVAEVADLSADFEQRRYDESGELVEDPSVGRFALLRGDCSCFRWHYDPPGELIIVADGEWVWYYDVELEQVDQRPESALPASSAILLNGAGALSDEYSVRELPPADDMRWIELTPLDPSASEFVSVKLGFAEGVPTVVELVDGLHELTRLAFSDIEVNAGQSAEDFEFVPPRGVHVVAADD
jgi:outer membrane lipoprotein carrier protein